MNNQEYENKKRECWEEFCIKNPAFNDMLGRKIFNQIYDRAYALGKQFGNPEQLNAEGEEMLTVSRKRVQNIYAQCEKIEMDDSPNLPAETIDAANTKMALLSSLFGSKCLPDETKELKPAEPKFKVGDMVRFKYSCTPYRIDGFKMLDGAMLYQVGEVWAEESDLELYTEPKEDLIPPILGELKSKEADKQFDNILKDSFRDHNRLQIAAILAAGLLANDARCYPIGRALELADELITINYCEKKDSL